MFETVSHTEVDDILFHFKLGDDMYRRGMYAEAIEEYQKALVLNPNYAEIQPPGHRVVGGRQNDRRHRSVPIGAVDQPEIRGRDGQSRLTLRETAPRMTRRLSSRAFWTLSRIMLSRARIYAPRAMAFVRLHSYRLSDFSTDSPTTDQRNCDALVRLCCIRLRPG